MSYINTNTMSNTQDFPKEVFIDLSSHQFLEGKITLHYLKDRGFMSEVQVVLKESQKIYAHVATLHGLDDETEALDRSVQTLADFLKKVR